MTSTPMTLKRRNDPRCKNCGHTASIHDICDCGQSEVCYWIDVKGEKECACTSFETKVRRGKSQ